MLVRQPLEQIPGEHARARKPCSLPHELKDGPLALPTNDGYIAEVDDESAPVKLLVGTAPGPSQLHEPRFNKLSFDHEPALGLCIDRRNLQHALGCARHTWQGQC